MQQYWIALGLKDKAKSKVNAEARLKVLKSRNKMALIFHAMNVTKPNVAINIQVALDERATSNRLAVLARFQHLPSVSECDLVKVLAVKPTYDGEGNILTDADPLHGFQLI